MRNPMGFFKELLRQPAWIPLWVGLLMMINMGSIGFWDEPLARWILGVFMASAMLMMGLYARFGFEKILGLGHFLWIPLLPVVVLAIPAADGGFRTFLVVWAVATSISLLLDIVDVWKHFSGARQATS
ncbi:MAG: hypothetical protein EA421_00795 [Gemmatimonadales bacterium]|nr:MAG: hypothetical protein EA421_00795 [Gemmatimonadales bacterium]